jgi:hypothetical protein
VRAPTVNSNDDSKDFLVASREIGLEVNSEKNKYIGKGMYSNTTMLIKVYLMATRDNYTFFPLLAIFMLSSGQHEDG